VITGDTIAQVLYLQTTAGVGASYANKAAFQAALWDLSWVDSSGVALTSQPTWSIAVVSGSTNGAHLLTYTLPSGFAVTKVTIPSGYVDPGTWTTFGEAYDADSLAGLMLTSQGVPGVQSAADGDLGDVVMGDSWSSGVQTVPLGKISPFGYSDLTGMTLTAALKQTPATSPVASSTTPNLFTTIVDASARTIKAEWITFPSAMNLGATASDLSADWFLDFQLKHTVSGRIITGLRYKLRVVWQRDVVT
jgi:hypothetical protein